MYDGWTPKITERTRITNNLLACNKLHAQDPNNEYWQDRANTAQLEFDEAADVNVDAFLFYADLAEIQDMNVPPEPQFLDDWCLQLENWPGELGESPTELRSLYGYG